MTDREFIQRRGLSLIALTCLAAWVLLLTGCTTGRGQQLSAADRALINDTLRHRRACERGKRNSCTLYRTNLAIIEATGQRRRARRAGRAAAWGHVGRTIGSAGTSSDYARERTCWDMGEGVQKCTRR